MLTHDHLLNLVKGHTAQLPLAKSKILAMGGISEELLDKVTEEMYERRMIGRCKLTKGGISDDMLWPTGVVNAPAYGRSSGIPTPPRRDLLTKKEEPAVQTTNLEKPKLIPSTRSIAMFVFEEKKVTRDQIYNKFPTPADRKSDFVYKLLWDLTKNNIVNVEKKPQAKDDILTIGIAYPAFIEKINKKMPKGTLINMPTADEYAIADKVNEKLGDAQTLPAFISIENQDSISRSEQPAEAIELPINYDLDFCVKGILSAVPEDCYITLHHPLHDNIRVEIDGTFLANPITFDLDKLPTVFGAIKTLQQVAQL